MKSFAVNLNPAYSIVLNSTTQTTTGQYFLATITGTLLFHDTIICDFPNRGKKAMPCCLSTRHHPSMPPYPRST